METEIGQSKEDKELKVKQLLKVRASVKYNSTHFMNLKESEMRKFCVLGVIDSKELDRLKRRR